MIILLPTVKHTGSHFVLKQLLNDFVCIDLKSAENRIEMIGEHENGVIFDHLFPHKRNLWEKFLGKYPAIIPIRNKNEVWKSWLKRSEDPDRELYDQMWWMVEDMDKYHPYYINIDNPVIRDEQLEFINLELKLNLDAGGWPVVRK